MKGWKRCNACIVKLPYKRIMHTHERDQTQTCGGFVGLTKMVDGVIVPTGCSTGASTEGIGVGTAGAVSVGSVVGAATGESVGGSGGVATGGRVIIGGSVGGDTGAVGWGVATEEG